MEEMNKCAGLPKTVTEDIGDDTCTFFPSPLVLQIRALGTRCLITYRACGTPWTLRSDSDASMIETSEVLAVWCS
jgi:hypothetical protein